MIDGQRITATVEARMTSSRLPGKVMMTAAGQPLLGILIDRLRRVPALDGIVVATTTNVQDDPIEALARGMGVGCFRGSEEDVLGRVCGALDSGGADVCVEITGDCPLVDPEIVQEATREYFNTRDAHPYVSNSDPHRSVPAGLDVQVFSARALYRLSDETSDPQDREHVSYGFYRPESGDRWRPRFIVHEAARGGEDLLVTLDYREDYELIRALHEDLSPHNSGYGARDIIAWLRSHPELEQPCRRVREEAERA
jgi:spore coat polysaccharide biosynthesis protein SpsF